MNHFHISYFSPEGVTVLDMIISQWGLAGRKKGNPTFENPNFYHILLPEKAFCLKDIVSIITFKASIPMSG